MEPPLIEQNVWMGFPKPAPQPRPHPAIFQALGAEGVQQMIRDFYDELGRSKVASLFPQGAALRESADNSALFWVTVLGGPELYEQKHGKPLIRQRHFRFTISPAEREVWLSCWPPALEKAVMHLGFPPDHQESFMAWVRTFSAWIVNTPPEKVGS